MKYVFNGVVCLFYQRLNQSPFTNKHKNLSFQLGTFFISCLKVTETKKLYKFTIVRH